MKTASLIAAVGLLLTAAPGAAKSSSVGTTVSDTTFRLATGEQHSFSEMRGEVVVLTYWMSDCRACQAQMDILDNYYRQRHQLGLRVFAVPTEDLDDGALKSAFRGKIIHPLSRLDGPFEMLGGVPTTYVVDRYGTVQYAAAEMLDTAKLNQILVPLLKQPQP
jgi:peroxiredoxin